MTDKVDAVRAVIEAARAWHHADPRWCQPVEDALDAAVFDLEAVFTTRHEELPNTMWRDVRPGDLVQTPRGEWIRVVDSKMSATAADQLVTLLINGESAGPFRRAAESKVRVRRPIDEMNRAIDLFADRFDISVIDPDQVTS
jgi:hypothetical protein